MKIYIAGAITNDSNYKKNFEIAETILKSRGFTVLNPVKNEGFTYQEYIDMGLNELSKCDAICLLDGWNKSKGARLELHYALTTGIEVILMCDIDVLKEMEESLHEQQ